MRTVRLFGAEHRELAHFQAQLNAEHRRTSRLALLQGAFRDNLERQVNRLTGLQRMLSCERQLLHGLPRMLTIADAVQEAVRAMLYDKGSVSLTCPAKTQVHSSMLCENTVSRHARNRAPHCLSVPTQGPWMR